jgi:hypothetical protein
MVKLSASNSPLNFEKNANPNILNGNLDAVFELIKEHGNAIFADTKEGSA